MLKFIASDPDGRVLIQDHQDVEEAWCLRQDQDQIRMDQMQETSNYE